MLVFKLLTKLIQQVELFGNGLHLSLLRTREVMQTYDINALKFVSVV